MVRILNRIWNAEGQPFEIWTNGGHFVKNHLKSDLQLYLVFNNDKSVFYFNLKLEYVYNCNYYFSSLRLPPPHLQWARWHHLDFKLSNNNTNSNNSSFNSNNNSSNNNSNKDICLWPVWHLVQTCLPWTKQLLLGDLWDSCKKKI